MARQRTTPTVSIATKDRRESAEACGGLFPVVYGRVVEGRTKLKLEGTGQVQSERRPGGTIMIRKLSSGQFRLYSRKLNPKTGRRRNLGTFKTRQAAEKHEKAVQFFKRR
jgi:hypothetical protein